jgi:hypothetical protein
MVAFIVNEEDSVSKILKESLEQAGPDEVLKAREAYRSEAQFYAESIAKDFVPTGRKMTKPEFRLLALTALLAIPNYGNSVRKLGGRYFNHAYSAAKIVSQERVNSNGERLYPDLITIIGTLYHDASEVQIAEHKTDTENFDELQLANFLNDHLVQELKGEMLKTGVRPQYIKQINSSLRDILQKVTGLRDESKYNQIGELFTSPDKKNGERAVAIKYADRLANTRDLDRPNGNGSSKYFGWIRNFYDPTIRLDDIAHFWDDFNYIKLPMKFALNKLIPEEREYFSLRGENKLKNFYKNSVLTNMKRQHKPIGRPSKEMAIVNQLEKELTAESNKGLAEHLRHILTYHINPLRAWVAYAELDRYEELGGFKGVTESHKWSTFDGYVKDVFDPILNGNKKVMQVLGTEKMLQYRATLLLKRLFEIYQREPNFLVKGIGRQGIHDLAAPAGIVPPLYCRLWNLASGCGKNLLNFTGLIS